MSQHEVPERLRLLLSDFANNIDLPELAFDGAGYATLRFGDAVDVTLLGTVQGLTLWADAGPLPSDRGLERAALQASFAREGGLESWYALDGEQHLLLYRRLSMDSLEIAALEAALAGLLADTAQWRGLIRSAEAASDKAAPVAMGSLA